MRTFLAVLLVSLGLGVHAQHDPETLRRTIDQIEQTIKQRPADPALWFFLSRFRAESGDTKGAIAAMEKVAELGDGFLPAPQLGFARVWDDPAFKAIVARMEAKLPRLDYAAKVFEIEDRGLIPEGLAYDAKSDNFFMGSIAKRKILRIDAHHAVTEFAGAAADLDAVLGIAVDGPRRRLYAASTSALTDEGEKQLRNTVVAFDVDTGKVLKRYDVPVARQLKDVTVALGGRVFVSDSLTGAVFELHAEGLPRQLMPPNQVRASNGLAASPDGKRLYVAHATGLAMVDTASGAVKRLVNRTRENIAAIDGLYEYQGDLIGVQNSTTPGRVILISLAKNGEEVTRVRTLVSHHHSALFEPTTGAVRFDNGSFYLLAATGVSHFGRHGKIGDPDTIPNPAVLRALLPR
jgi:streptogramin lyase